MAIHPYGDELGVLGALLPGEPLFDELLLLGVEDSSAFSLDLRDDSLVEASPDFFSFAFALSFACALLFGDE